MAQQDTVSTLSAFPRRNAAHRADVRLHVRPEEGAMIACLATVVTVLGIVSVNPHSLQGFAWYALVWHAFIFVFHRDDLEDFAFAFAVNSAFIAIFFLVQSNVYPDSYGTTSPLGSWTDDSYFFALVADSIPANLVVRDFYFLYTHPFTSLIHVLTLPSIDHPMDAIFFQSGIAALLATSSKRFMLQLSSDARLSQTVFVFVVICPFLMMNGGVILLRDTFTAALFVYSLCCINAGRPLLAAGAIALHFAIRPGTALLLIPAYVVIYFRDIKTFVTRHLVATAIALALGVVTVFRLVELAPDLVARAAGTSEGGGLTFLGREFFDSLTADPDANTLFLSIQGLPFPIRVVLNGGYIFLYPFLGLQQAFAGDHFDLRSVTLDLVDPIYAFWLNAWFIAGCISRTCVAKRQREVIVAVLVTLAVVGTYSLQTRHKILIYPLYYFVIAIGLCKARPVERRIGYIVSSALMLLQLAAALR